MDTAPGPAYTTVDGKITKIEGAVYTIQSESTGYQNLGGTTNFSALFFAFRSDHVLSKL
jgi:hypothetical protein